MKKSVSVIAILALSVLVVQFAWAGNGVLLVDDDCSVAGYADVRPTFEAALQAAGLVPVATATLRGEYEVYEVPNITANGPDYNKLKNYKAVIWFTGETCCAMPNCITPTDEVELEKFLNDGGGLFVSAQDYLNYWPNGALPDTSFPYEYLKVASCTTDVWQDTGYVAQGTAGAITEGLQFELMDPFSKKSSSLMIDWIEPQALKANALGEFYIDEPGVGTGFAAMSYKTGDQPTDYKVFFSTICLAALKDELGTDNTKGELMSRIMSWFLGDYADYGDAPDPPYCSYFENDGARHVNSEYLYEWLGENVDLEFNSWQVDADLYDDGVIFNTPFVPGAVGSVSVTVSVSSLYPASDPDRYYASVPFEMYWYLYLSAWFDWNQDNDWYDNLPSDSLEWVIQNFKINPIKDGWAGTSHTYNITFPVPDWATNNDMWCRFRLAYDADFHVYYDICGYKSFGEVEDYVIGNPLSVGLSTFYASAGDGQATLYWTTESEVNNLGFYVQRSEAGGQYVRVNEQLIPGHGTSETRHEYSYVDQGLTNGVAYSYRVVDVDLAGTQTAHGPITVTPQASAGVPTEYALSQNYPNPFNAQTTISYAIPQDSQVSMKLFNILGEEVRTLVDGHQKANTYQVTWDGKDADGRSVASGVYFCTLKAGEFSQTTKMVFLK
jgi:hypothetical protein